MDQVWEKSTFATGISVLSETERNGLRADPQSQPRASENALGPETTRWEQSHEFRVLINF